MPNKAPEPTITAVTICAPSSTAHASRDRGSSLTLGKAMKYAAIAVLGYAILSTPSFACRCELPSVEESVRRSDVIFIGRVTNLSLQVGDHKVAVKVRCTFTELTALKGVASQRSIVIATGPDEPACGFSFRLGEYYLVYARMEDGELHTSICDRTQTILGAVRIKEGRDGGSVADYVADMAGEKEAAAVRLLLAKKPNKAPEPTPTAVMPAAEQPSRRP